MINNVLLFFGLFSLWIFICWVLGHFLAKLAKDRWEFWRKFDHEYEIVKRKG